jgi:hypothetical protein
MHERMGLHSVGPEFIVHGLTAHEPVSQRDEYRLQEAVTSRQGLCRQAGLVDVPADLACPGRGYFLAPICASGDARTAITLHGSS